MLMILEHLPAVWLLRFRGFSKEEQAFCSASEFFQFYKQWWTAFVLYVYSILSEISNVISCCLPTDTLTTFTHNRFDSKYFICLQLAGYQFPSIISEFGGMCRSRNVDRQDVNPTKSFQNSLAEKFSPQKCFCFK